MDAQTPGILNEPLKAFAKSRGKIDVKLSFDGKKLATGYGNKLGEEDIGGFEEPPTLQERKLRLEKEQQIFLLLKEHFPQSANSNNVVHFSNEDKELIIKGMTVLSVRIKELRILIVKKEAAVNNLMKKVEGDWRKSNMNYAISYMKTRIFQIGGCVSKLLGCIDDLAFTVACANEVGHAFRRGTGVIVDLQHQGNYMCLKEMTA